MCTWNNAIRIHLSLEEAACGLNITGVTNEKCTKDVPTSLPALPSTAFCAVQNITCHPYQIAFGLTLVNVQSLTRQRYLILLNPRRACAARVRVVGSVCLLLVLLARLPCNSNPKS